jgi:hypothetical protein
MKSQITYGLDADKTKEMIMDFKAAVYLRRRLTDLLQKDIEARRRETASKLSYDNPNWTYLQADAMGYERALRELISLLED